MYTNKDINESQIPEEFKCVTEFLNKGSNNNLALMVFASDSSGKNDGVMFSTNSSDPNFLKRVGFCIASNFVPEPKTEREYKMNIFISSILGPVTEMIRQYHEDTGIQIDFDHCDPSELDNEQLDKFIDYQITKKRKSDPKSLNDPTKYWCEDHKIYHDKTAIKLSIDKDSGCPVIQANVKDVIFYISSYFDLEVTFIHPTIFEGLNERVYSGYQLESPEMTLELIKNHPLNDRVDSNKVYILNKLPSK